MPRAARAKESDTAGHADAPGVPLYTLRLYVAGSSFKSTRAIQIVSELCDSLPRGRCNVEVIDLYQQPGLARQDNIVAVPSLVKVHPPPRRAFVGFTEDKQRILHRLGIPITIYDGSKKKTR
ncbi:MAG TPA: circadian clock KaiB family protein [Terriglobales bacterium]|nr:circadian clock KaiB family protein [Terriglobales bacterium]